MTPIKSVVLTQLCSEVKHAQAAAIATLALTADERTKSRHCFTRADLDIYLQLPRGTVLHHGDVLRSTDGEYMVRVEAEPEPVMAVTGAPLILLQAAYHLGNRHVPVEIAVDQLQLAPDPVLRPMLVALGLTVTDTLAPFQPESGVYAQHHNQSGHTHNSHG